VIARTAVLAVAFVMTQSAPAPVEWRVIYPMPDGTFSIDPASLLRTENTVTVTTRLTSRMADTGAEFAVIAQLRFDCVQRTSTMLEATVPGNDGRPIRHTPDPIKTQPVAGYAGLEAALNELCPR
jgi:hypothetical protein